MEGAAMEDLFRKEEKRSHEHAAAKLIGELRVVGRSEHVEAESQSGVGKRSLGLAVLSVGRMYQPGGL